MTVTLTLDVPADLAQRVHALPPRTLNHFAVAALPGVLDAAETAQTGLTGAEPVDMNFVEELREAFAEAERVGTIFF